MSVSLAVVEFGGPRHVEFEVVGQNILSEFLPSVKQNMGSLYKLFGRMSEVVSNSRFKSQ